MAQTLISMKMMSPQQGILPSTLMATMGYGTGYGAGYGTGYPHM
jgi:hypothetical protein